MMTMRTDEELVSAYQKRGDMLSLTQLRTRTRALVQSQVNRYMAGPGHISRAAMEARADELLIEAAKSYRPTAGAKFSTHLFNHLRRLDRYTKANANIAHVPEARASAITMFTTQEKILWDQKRRQPTDEELADHLAWPFADVKRIRKSMRRELPWSQVAGPQQAAVDNARVDQLLDDMYFELSADERVVFDHVYGAHGKKKLTQGNAIAKATGFSPAKVSVLRSRIAERLRPYLNQQTQVAV